ncbi:hypothetical protein [Corynebacterium kalidii]
MIEFITNLMGQLIEITHLVIGYIAQQLPGATPDCSDWVNPGDWYPGGTWPDGTPIPDDIVCGDA